MSCNGECPLSVVILATETGALLETTLHSLAALPGERLVVPLPAIPPTDTGIESLNHTFVGVRQLAYDWRDDFAACRNAALAESRGAWVLWLEAGEWLPASTVADLSKTLFSNNLDSQSAYELPVCGMIGDWGREQVYQVRLHPRREDVRFVGVLRERIASSPAGPALVKRRWERPILRSAAMRHPARVQARSQLLLKVAQRQLEQGEASAELQNCLGEAYLALGQVQPAARHYQQVLRQATSGAVEQLEAYYGLLTCLDAAGPDRHAQLSLVLQALEAFPLDAQLLVAMGGYLRSLDYLPTAARAFDVAFREGQVEPRLWHLLEIRELAAACGASTCLAMGQPDAALRLLEAAWRMSPSSRLLPRELASTYRRVGRMMEAEQLEAWLQRTAGDAVGEAGEHATDEGMQVRVDPPRAGQLAPRGVASQEAERAVSLFPRADG